MNFPTPFSKLTARAAVLGLALGLALPAHAATMPRLEADSFGGTHVVLPNDANGKPLVLLLAFTTESEADLKKWSKKFLDDKVEADAAVYVVVVADKVVFFGHNKVRKMVENAEVGSKEQRDKQVLITFNGDGWRQLTPPGDKAYAGIVVVDKNGNIVLSKREAYTAENLAEVEKLAR